MIHTSAPVLLLLFMLAHLSTPPSARAQWTADGVPVCTVANDQYNPRLVADGAGGAVVAWYDFRTGNADIYVQRLSGKGVAQWAQDGVALSTAASSQIYAAIVADGTGGAIVTWQDFRSGSNFDVYVQRVSATGVPQWTANGVALCTAANGQELPTIASDGSGGAIVTWYDGRSGTNFDIYAQRVSATGVPQWTANGVALCTAASDQNTPRIVSDGSGGAVVTWQDYRTGASLDIYAQRVSATGVPQWTANGVALSTAPFDQYGPDAVSDGSGGAIVTWQDLRSGVNADIYAQRVSAAGVPQWTANGAALSVATDAQLAPTIASDGAGGAMVAWQDHRGGSNFDVYVQRVSAAGVPQWTANGVVLCNAGGNQEQCATISDGAGGAVVAWFDARNGTTPDIYAQRVAATGAIQWTVNGVALCSAANEQYRPQLVWDGSGGAIAAWYDRRAGHYDVYSQRVEERYGYWGHPEPTITSVADVPGDQGGRVNVNWSASDWDELNRRTISHYSIWRATEFVPGAALVSGAEQIDADFDGIAYRADRTVAGDEYYWEWIGSQDARYTPLYSFSAATRADSTSQGPSQHYFQVLSHTADAYTFWPSNVASGYSVDNLAPAAPLLLTAQRVGADVRLGWNGVSIPDLRDYAVYRATVSGVTAIPGNFLASVDDTLLLDINAPTQALYYIVTAYDVHENQSAPSNEASVGAATGVGNLPPIDGLTVLAHHPNPFHASAAVDVGLPVNSVVELEIFDVAGRRVAARSLGAQTKGWQRFEIRAVNDGGGALPSGVYFYRIRAAGETVTRKMVVAP